MVRYRWNTVTDNILCEQNDAGNLLATYTHEPGYHGELISQRRDGKTNYYHYDGEGNTRALTDENGNVTDTYTYNAFGETIAQSGTTTNPFGFKGALGYYANPGIQDFDTRERPYQPRTARWLTSPSVWGGLADGGNQYTSEANNPVRRGAQSCFLAGSDLTDPNCQKQGLRPFGLLCYDQDRYQDCVTRLQLGATFGYVAWPCAAMLLRNFLSPQKIDPYCPAECKTALRMSSWLWGELRALFPELRCGQAKTLKKRSRFGGPCQDPFAPDSDLAIAIGAVDNADFTLDFKYACTPGCYCCVCDTDWRFSARVTDTYDFISTVNAGASETVQCAAIVEDYNRRRGNRFGTSFKVDCHVSWTGRERFKEHCDTYNIA